MKRRKHCWSWRRQCHSGAGEQKGEVTVQVQIAKGLKDSRGATGVTSVFKGPQSFGKAVLKKSLPQSPSKILHVIAKVVQDMSPNKKRAVLEVCNNPVKRRTLERADRRKKSDARLGDEKLKIKLKIIKIKNKLKNSTQETTSSERVLEERIVFQLRHQQGDTKSRRGY